MADKFVRALIYDTGSTTTARVSHYLKMVYEFWGFCVNGTSSLTVPGGFATTTPSTMPGNFNGVLTTIAAGSNAAVLPQATINVVSTTGFPTSGVIYVMTTLGTQIVNYTGVTGTTFTGCTSGLGTMATGGNVTSSGLMALGSDGYTNATTVFRQDGYSSFFANSGQFNSNMIGKILTTWKPNSNSSEDSIYKIIAYISPSEIIINVNNGGTPSSSNDGYKPTFTNRTSINYRVSDVQAAALVTADGNYFVLQLDPSAINAGQASSQCKFTIASSNFSYTAQLSPGGTWNGSVFTDGTSVITPGFSNQMNTSTSLGVFCATLWGDKDYLMSYNAWQNQSTPDSFFHLEIPERIYTQAQDPNPITITLVGRQTQGSIYCNTTVASYGGGFVMRCFDGVSRNHRTSVRALMGDGANATTVGGVASIGQIPGYNNTNSQSSINQYTGTMLNSYGYLSMVDTVGQFCLARVKLRKVRFANSFMPLYTRLSSNGDFILGPQGICLPWDKSVLPNPLFPF